MSSKPQYMTKMERPIVGSEDPHSFVRDWLIPWYANGAVWAVTVSAVVVTHAIENPRLLIGPPPKFEKDAVIALADPRTVWWPLAVVALLGLIIGWLSRHPLKKRKGRKAPVYLFGQFVDEGRSFALNAASLSAVAGYYASSRSLFGSALVSWSIWAVFQWVWLKKNGKSPLDT
jgi:hypothetical protein